LRVFQHLPVRSDGVQWRPFHQRRLPSGKKCPGPDIDNMEENFTEDTAASKTLSQVCPRLRETHSVFLRSGYKPVISIHISGTGRPGPVAERL
jgi:hypothetical protein